MNLTEAQRDGLRDVAARATDHLDSIPQDTHGLKVFVVGGAIRDVLIPSASANDLDFMVVGETADSMLDRGFENIHVSSFGVFHDDEHEEWSLARTETKPDDANGYKGLETDTEGVSLYDDLLRRDLRMNAMALQIRSGPPIDHDIDDEDIEMIQFPNKDLFAFFVDPFQGRADIEAGEIRHVSDAFAEDPLRVMRAARYAARFEQQISTEDGIRTVPFSVADETAELMRKVSPELNRMSRERIGDEVVKAMKQAVNPTRFWEVLRDTGALAVISPHLDRATVVPAGPEEYHREGNTFRHTMMVLDRMHRLCESRGITGRDRVRRYMMAVAHDLGKVTVADDKGGLWSDDPPRRFGGHDTIGAEDAANMADRLGLEGHIKETMRDAAEFHMDVYDIPTWPATRLTGFVNEHTPADDAKKPFMATITELIDLAHADHTGRFQDRAVFNSVDDFTETDAAPDGAVRPEFHREEYHDAVTAAQKAYAQIKGYDVMREGLCSSHSDDTIKNSNVAGHLEQCDSCKSPGPWVGEKLDEKRASFVIDQLG